MEKTFSCSNTSKNAVQYITIRTISFISPGSAFQPLPLFWPRFFSGKWCKDKSSFWNHQIFSKEFFQKFSEPFFLSFRTVFLIRSGCKGKSFFRISKRFWNFFQNFSEPVFSAPEQYFSLEADAKIRAFRSYFQIIPGLFFDNFTTFFTHGYRSAS